MGDLNSSIISLIWKLKKDNNSMFSLRNTTFTHLMNKLYKTYRLVCHLNLKEFGPWRGKRGLVCALDRHY